MGQFDVERAYLPPRGHTQGLKPDSFRRIGGTAEAWLKPCPDTRRRLRPFQMYKLQGADLRVCAGPQQPWL